MKILSITTSSKICGVSILEDTNIIKEINLDNGLTHSEALMPLIKQIFKETNLTLSDMDLLISDIGPGSFTGIRIGIATIKAFADSLNIPSIGVSSLDSLTYNSQNMGVICSLIDAKKNNVYCEIFENILNSAFSHIVKRNASFENIEDLLAEIKSIEPEYDITFVGDGAIIYKDIILKYLPSSKFVENNNLSASKVGFAGFYNYLKQTAKEPMPLYLRKSEAEKKMEEKLNETK